MHDDPFYSVFHPVFFVNVDVIRLLYRIAREWPVHFDLSQSLCFVIFVPNVSFFGPAWFVDINVFVRHCRRMCASIFGVTPFAICDVTVTDLMFAMDDLFLAFNFNSFYPNTGVRVVRWCGRCPIDQCCTQNAAIAGG